MVIILEKKGLLQRIAVPDHIGRQDTVQFENLTYHRTGAPVFEYRAPVRWVAGTVPGSYEIKVDRFKLRVFKWQGASWIATCGGILNPHDMLILEARDLDDAKAEALGLVRNILTQILEDLPCR